MEPYKKLSVALERDTQKREHEWLLKSKMSIYLDKLRCRIESCMKSINPKTDLRCNQLYGEKDGQCSKEVINFKVSDNLKGCLKIDGWNIIESELTIRFPKFNKGATYSISSSNTEPWKLHQLQNVYMFLSMAMNRINIPDLVSANRIMECIDEVIYCLKQAQSEMEAEYPLIGNTNDAFFPSMPENLYVCFNILNASYVIAVYLLRSQKHSKVFEFLDRRQAYEDGVLGLKTLDANFSEAIADSIQCMQPSKNLERFQINIHGMMELCLEIREKLIAVPSID